jgi:hypothetical protein
MSRRAAALLAWSAWTLCVVLAAIAVLLALLTPPGHTKTSSNWGVFLSVSLLAYPTVGAIVASRCPKNLVGWILCGIGLLFGIEAFAEAYPYYALTAGSDWLPGGVYMAWLLRR